MSFTVTHINRPYVCNNTICHFQILGPHITDITSYVRGIPFTNKIQFVQINKLITHLLPLSNML